jgi:hypothetical protein
MRGRVAGLKSAGAFAGQHMPAAKHGGGESCVSGGGVKNCGGEFSGPGEGGVVLHFEPFVFPCSTW